MIDSGTSLKAVIFDLGNVIARIDFQRPFQAMGCFLNRPVSPQARQELMRQADEYERGRIGSREFLLFLQDLARRENPLLPAGVPSLDTLRDIWNCMITDLPAQNLQLVARIRKRYLTCLLSNTNVLHMRYVEALQNGFEGGFSSVFDKIYLSCDLKSSKPDPEIYRHVLRDLGLPAHQCLFIDDRIENIEGARKEGIRTCLLEDFDLQGLFTPEGEPADRLRKNMS